jgi:hypothetical protein
MMKPSESPTGAGLHLELDPREYAQGKSRDEETRDSVQMLAYSLISLVLAAVIAIGLWSYASL